tara:strand:- start:1179 stop:2087 length:909 start_codon:yes stop_codon:yes gene_type:complete
MHLSIVTTSYNSASTITNFFSELKKVISELNISDYEVIVVDDGSKDETVEILKKIKENFNNLKIIILSKNYGHHKALITGLNESIGKLIFLLDSDLEENPSELKNLLKEIENYDFVYGIQKKRAAGLITNFFGNIFYKLFNFVSSAEIPRNLMTMTLMKYKVKEELDRFKEKEIFFHGILHTIGFKKKGIIIDKTFKGKTAYTLSKKLNLFFDAITSFSSLPLKIFFYLGLIISSISAVYAIYLIFRYLSFKISVAGFTTLAVLVLFFGGLIILGIGILGIYIQKIFLEVKNRPRVTVKDKD